MTRLTVFAHFIEPALRRVLLLFQNHRIQPHNLSNFPATP